MSDALLDAAPVDDRARLEDAKLAAEASALFFHSQDGRLVMYDAYDGVSRRRNDAGAARVPIAAGAGRGGGRAAE